MKKHMLSILALAVAAVSLIVSALALNRAAQLEEQYALLQQPDQGGDISGSRSPDVLQSWQLNGTPWADGLGADVRMTAFPISYDSSLTASLQVSLQGSVIMVVPCRWDGNAYTASVSLTADNGYSYSLILEKEGGILSEVDLASEYNLSDPLMVYLGDALSSYSNLMIDRWGTTGDTLTITGGIAQIHLPQLGGSAEETPLATLNLTLEQEGAVPAPIYSKNLDLTSGEASNSFEADLSGTVFELPALQEGDRLALSLSVTYPDGRTEAVGGAEWYCESGDLILVAG